MYSKRSKSRNSVLPHLPKAEAMPNIQISNAPLMPGKKTLPSADWKNDGQIVRQGVPWTDRQSKVQLDSELEPPPMFTATPSKTVALRRTQKNQSHAYRMDSGIDPVIILINRLETWRLALKNLTIPLLPFSEFANMKLEICSFSGQKIYPSKGKTYVRIDSRFLIRFYNRTFKFINGKAESYFLQRLNPRKIRWTSIYRRLNKKGMTEEVHKKRSRRTVKHDRAVVA
ncbi:hypothetical protein G6F56_005846 [Rhizopus delemar]|nr:hypothetical protein G6F56_005846 [Rhizopus delemar]